MWDLSDVATLDSFKTDGFSMATNGWQEFFKVDENANTGYSWIVDKSSCTSKIVKITSGYKAPAWFVAQ